eukprot:NODE_643_length_5058_cov_0.251664.p2 type:complete len:387 gc:universal NODE_643_length_5058_cov_0.251664:2025-865(-)
MSLQSSAFNFQLLNYKSNPHLQDCQDIFNGVIVQYKGHLMEIVRCYLGIINDRLYSEIRILYNHQMYKLNITETTAYKTQFMKTYWMKAFGPEDPRVTVFNNELYLYFTMTNSQAQDPFRGMEMMKIEHVLQGNSTRQFLNVITDKPSQLEKNWLFFHNHTNLLVLYNLKPFSIGEMIDNQLQIRINRNYDCIDHIKEKGVIHFSSNAIRIQNHQKEEYMFIFSVIRTGDKFKQYLPFLGFFEANAPHRLLRISENVLDFNVNYDQFVYYSSMTVDSKVDLVANLHDRIIISGGIDDKKVFKLTSTLENILTIKTQQCHEPFSEWDYFKVQIQSNSSKLVNTPSIFDHFMETSTMLFIILVVIAILYGLIRISRILMNRQGYDKLT